MLNEKDCFEEFSKLLSQSGVLTLRRRPPTEHPPPRPTWSIQVLHFTDGSMRMTWTYEADL